MEFGDVSGLFSWPCRKKGPHLAMTGHLVGFLQLRRQYQISHEVQRGAQRASLVVLGTSGLHACGEGECVIALES